MSAVKAGGDAPGLESSHLARNLMSCHDVTTLACDPISAYALVLHWLRKISVTLIAAGSVTQLTCGSIYTLLA